MSWMFTRSVNASNSTIVLTFFNTGGATVVFHVRSGNAADPVRYYTVEPGKTLAGVWNVASSYDFSVYGPNGFARYFNGSIGGSARLSMFVPPMALKAVVRQST